MPKYKDTALNRRLGRVGKEHGSADITKLPPKKKKETPPPPPPPKTPPPKKKNKVKELKPDSPKTARKFALGILGESEKSYNDKYSKQLVKKRALQKEVKTKVPKYLALKKKLGGGARVDKDGKPVPQKRATPKPPSYESIVKPPVPAPRKPKKDLKNLSSKGGNGGTLNHDR